ncbi:hypothetical protein Trydic_g17982 [Trypoxylus dichotomus]
MASFDESAIIKKHVRSINFLKDMPPKTAVSPSDTSPHNTDGDTITSSTSCHSDKFDSIRSCESVIKIFKFETGTFDKNNEKCLAFWEAINNREDIKPVNCTIMDAQDNKRTHECQTEQKESEASLWARALYELRKRKLDKVALAATNANCKFCKTLNIRFASSVPDPKDLLDDQDLSELDNWSPRRSNKETQFSTKEISRDFGTSVQSNLNVVSQYTDTSSQEVEQLINISELQGSDETTSDSSTSSHLKSIHSTSPKILSTESKSMTEKVTCVRNLDIDTSEDVSELGEKFSLSAFGLLDPTSVTQNITGKKDSGSVEKKIAACSPAISSIGKSRENTDFADRKKVSIADVVRVPRKATPPDLAGHIRTPKGSGSHNITVTQDKDKESQKQTLPESKSISFGAFEISERRTRGSNEGKSEVNNIQSAVEPLKEVAPNKLPRRPSLKMASQTQSSFRDLEKDTKPIENDADKDLNSKASNESMNMKKGRQRRSFSKVSDEIPRKQISFFYEAASDSREKVRGKATLEQYQASSLPALKDSREPLLEDYNQIMMKQKPSFVGDSKPNLITPISSENLEGTGSVSSKKETGKSSRSDVILSEGFSTGSSQKSTSRAELDNTQNKSLDAQHLTSLLDIDTLKSLHKIAERKRALEEELRKVQALGSKEEIDPIYLCPCLNTLKNTTCVQCSCKQGVCLKPDEDDLEKMEQVFDHLPATEKPKLKCFLKILCKIRRIMKENLGQEETDAKIIKVLTGLGPCECDGGPCECQLHHLDLTTLRDNEDYMTATILDEFNKVLDEKLQSHLGITLERKRVVRNKRLSTSDLTTFNVDTSQLTAYEKWFCLSQVKRSYYTTLDEANPERHCKTKQFITKTMIIAAVAIYKEPTRSGQEEQRRPKTPNLLTQQNAKR